MKRKYEPSEKMGIPKGLDYIKSTPGVLKIFEFVALVISISSVTAFMDTLNNSRGTWNFFLAVVIISCILAAITFFFFTLGVHEKFKSVDWPLAVGIVFLIFTALLLVAAAILADNTRNYKVSGLCDSWATASGDIECNNLIVASVFAFVAFLLYALDSLLHFWLSVTSERGNVISEETAEMEPNSSANAV